MLSDPSSTLPILTTTGKELLAQEVVQVARHSHHLPIWAWSGPVLLHETCLLQVPGSRGGTGESFPVVNESS